ncbi:MAG: hypothetical protein M3Z02_07810 [Actinomycetota bacterium]|nr:hypothetical protein [Actinomycetota bacterium]
MDVQAKIDELTAQVESARAMPMSASCVINRTEFLRLLDELRELLPTELHRAEFVLRDRDEVIEEGRREAERIIEGAHEERTRLVGRTEVFQQAAHEAERVVAEAAQRSEVMRSEVDDYVDTRLANFEIVLHKTLSAVERGRDKLRGRHDLVNLTDAEMDQLDESPLPG